MTPASLLLDTSFLVSFVDARRPYHAAAMAFYRYSVAQRLPLFLSVLTAGEFARRQEITDLPLGTLRLLPYNLPHAQRAAAFDAPAEPSAADGLPPAVPEEVKLLAQAHEEGIAFVLTERPGALHEACARLRRAGQTRVEAIALADGFDVSYFAGGQRELRFGET